jgi:hypothetical protein
MTFDVFYLFSCFLPIDPPTTVTSESSRILAESASPLMRALVDYQAQFQMHLTQSQTAEKISSSKIRWCEKSLSCIRLQSEAMEAAILNLQNFEGYKSYFSYFFISDLSITNLVLDQCPSILMNS